jgi:hypothetical protein
MKRIARRRRSQSDIDKILVEYRRSGLAQTAFSERRWVPLSTLTNGLRIQRIGSKRRCAKQSGSQARLVPIRIVDAPHVPSSATLELESARGYMLRFPVGLDPELLARYVEALETQC